LGDTEFESLRLINISKLKKQFGTPQNFKETVHETIEAEKEENITPTTDSSARAGRFDKLDVAPCLLDGGDTRNPEFGICRLEWIDGARLEAIADVTGEEMAILQSLGQKVLVLSIKRQSAAGIKNDLNQIQGKSRQEIKNALPFSRFDQQLDGLLVDAREELRLEREKKLIALENQEDTRKKESAKEGSLKTAQELVSNLEKELLATPTDRRAFVDSRLKAARAELAQLEEDMDAVEKLAYQRSLAAKVAQERVEDLEAKILQLEQILQ
jgi:hypothetical protein